MRRINLYIAGEPQKLLIVPTEKNDITVYAIPQAEYNEKGLDEYNKMPYAHLPESVREKIENDEYRQISVNQIAST